jgi:hypothetical protein
MGRLSRATCTIHSLYTQTKGQLNSEWIYEDINFPKYEPKNLKNFALKVFKASLGLPGSFLGPPGDLVSNIIKKTYMKPEKASWKPQGSYKNFQGNILLIFWFVFWKIDDFINSF